MDSRLHRLSSSGLTLCRVNLKVNRLLNHMQLVGAWNQPFGALAVILERLPPSTRHLGRGTLFHAVIRLAHGRKVVPVTGVLRIGGIIVDGVCVDTGLKLNDEAAQGG